MPESDAWSVISTQTLPADGGDIVGGQLRGDKVPRPSLVSVTNSSRVGGNCWKAMLGVCRKAMLGVCRKAMLGVCRKVMLGVCWKAMLGVCRKAMLGVCRKAMLGVWIQGIASLSPFLIGRTFVRKHSWEYSANKVDS